uniref:Uncharacterized protein n=1 Tax=Arundo donax TaxID=35708 RepID=A0A0A9HBJ7_ARUDO
MSMESNQRLSIMGVSSTFLVVQAGFKMQ